MINSQCSASAQVLHKADDVLGVKPLLEILDPRYFNKLGSCLYFT